MKQYVFDLEGDGLYPSKIHCLVVNTGKSIRSVTKYDTMRKALQSADTLIGHNIIRFDIPTIERLLNIKINARLVDTLALSWYLYPLRVRHGLEYWGEDFGVPKPKIDDWENLSIEEYVHRCTEDVKINTQLWEKQYKLLLKIYEDDEEAVWRLIDFLSFKMQCARQAEEDKWKLDVDKCTKGIEELEAEMSVLTEQLKAIMPEVPKYKIKSKPAKPYKKDGSLSAHGEKWFSLLKEEGLPEDYQGDLKILDHFEEPKPSSPEQVKAWLFELGWEPENFKFVRDKEDFRNVRKIPQVRIDGDGGKELCPSVLKLKDANPGIEALETITVIAHRLGLLRGFMENCDEDGYTVAQIQGLTNTLRFKHTTIVNLPGAFKPYGELVRGCLIAPEGYELCGADMSGLEDRTKQHYMYKYDPDYVNEMNTPDFDPHLDIALVAKMMTQEQVDAYKNGDHTLKPVRHKAKTTNYSCTYGAKPPKIAMDSKMPLSEAEELFNAYWERNWSIEAIAKDCEVKTVNDGENNQMWLFNPVSGFWYSLRHEKDRFSTLNQGTGAYCFDRWLYYILQKRKQLNGQFHDEGVFTIKKGNRDKAEKLLQWAIEQVNNELNLNRRLDIGIQFGDNYAEIH